MAPHASNMVPVPSGNDKQSPRYHELSTREAILNEHEYAAHNYSPLPIVIARAKGASVWDPEGRHYLDFLSSFSSVNQGHCHPELVKALVEQASRLTLTGRAFHNDVFPQFAKFVTNLFGYEMVLPTSTGAEAVETAIKISRKWGYKVKGIPENEAIVLSATDNFHGRTMTAVSLSSDPTSRNLYGPHLPNSGPVCPATGRVLRYNSIPDLHDALEAHGSRTASVILEPIQGEAGTVVPSDDYLQEVKSLCEKHRVLFICDEIQTGIARTGRMLCYEWSNIKPDIVLLGKSLSGGMLPVSCVLGSKDVMLTVEAGTHGSTFGGNPLGCFVAIRALELVNEENLVERANAMGELLRKAIADLNHPLIKTIRGKGLLNVMVLNEKRLGRHTLWDLCLLLRDKGIITKSVSPNLIRLAPPLVINATQIAQAVEIISSALTEFAERP